MRIRDSDSDRLRFYIIRSIMINNKSHVSTSTICRRCCRRPTDCLRRLNNVQRVLLASAREVDICCFSSASVMRHDTALNRRSGRTIFVVVQRLHLSSHTGAGFVSEHECCLSGRVFLLFVHLCGDQTWRS